jgi:hypothetical protein
MLRGGIQTTKTNRQCFGAGAVLGGSRVRERGVIRNDQQCAMLLATQP